MLIMSGAATSSKKCDICCCGKRSPSRVRPNSPENGGVFADPLHSEPLPSRWLRKFLHQLLSPISNALSMLVITLAALVLAGELIAKLENSYSLGRQDTLRYITRVLADRNLTDGDLLVELSQWSVKSQWSALHGTYYTYSLISTTGYGRYSTVSGAGRIVSAIFLVLVVPIGVLYVQCLTCVYHSMLARCLLHYRDKIFAHSHLAKLIFPSGDVDIVVVPVTLLTGVMQLHLLLAIPFLYRIERWSSIEVLYYLTCSMTTVGFGDFHPGPHSFTFVLAIIVYQFHLGAIYMLIINYLNDAFEWILQSYYSHGFEIHRSL